MPTKAQGMTYADSLQNSCKFPLCEIGAVNRFGSPAITAPWKLGLAWPKAQALELKAGVVCVCWTNCLIPQNPPLQTKNIPGC